MLIPLYAVHKNWLPQDTLEVMVLIEPFFALPRHLLPPDLFQSGTT